MQDLSPTEIYIYITFTIRDIGQNIKHNYFRLWFKSVAQDDVEDGSSLAGYE